MKLIDGSVERPHSVVVVVLLCVIFGYLAVRSIPVQLKPSLDRPEIRVDTVYPGASPHEVEEQITNLIEEEMDSVEGIKKITSTSGDGSSSVVLEFEWGVNKNTALIDVINKLNQVPDLPDDAEEPVVLSVDSESNEPVMFIIMESDSLNANELFEVGEDGIEPRFRRVEGVSDMWFFGGEERELQVRVDPEKLAAFGITMSHFHDSLRRENLNVRGGFLDEGRRQFSIRTTGQFLSSADIGDIIITRDGLHPVYVKEFATVGFGYKRQASVLRVNGKPTVVFGILRKSGANVVDICREFEIQVDALNTEFAGKGMDVRLQIVHSDVAYIDQAIQLAWQNLLIGGLLASIVLVVFLRSVRTSLVVAISIPICMITVFIFLKELGRTLNIISLAGLAFSAGMIVDNAIVVIENIYRHLQMGKSPAQAAREGTAEVWGAIITSTLTTLAVFIPIIMMQDETGQLFKDLAIAISLAIFFSLLASITLIPMLASILCRVDNSGTSAMPRGFHPLRLIGRPFGLIIDRIGKICQDMYMGIIVRMIGPGIMRMIVKSVVIIVVVLLFFQSLRLLPNAEYLPNGNRNLIFFFAKPLVGNNLNKTVEDVEPLEKILHEDSRVKRFFTVFSNRFQAIGVILKDEIGPDGTNYTDEKEIKKFLGHMFTITMTAGIKGFEVLFPVQASIFRDPGKEIEIDIVGPDLDRLQTISAEIQGQLYQTPDAGVKFIRSSFSAGNPEVQIIVDRVRCAPLQLRTREVATMVESMKAGSIVGIYNDHGKQIDLTVYAGSGKVEDRLDLAMVPLATPSGHLVKLEDVAELRTTTGPTRIEHVEKERSITLTVNLKDDVAMEAAITAIEDSILSPANAKLPANFNVRLSGTADRLGSTIKAMTQSFILAVVIVYLLMVSLFRSFIYPLVILTTIPLATSGAFLGITIAHAQSDGLIIFDVIAMLGLIILSGIVVNNAILIVHQSLNFERAGMSPKEALTESCRTRLRPICMSVVTSVLGMLPLAMGSGAGTELYRGLGWVIIGGLTVSTVFTLFLVPALYGLFLNLKAMVIR